MKKIFALIASLALVAPLVFTSCATSDSVAKSGGVKKVKPKKFVQADFDSAVARGDLDDALSMTVGRKYAKNDVIIQKMDIAMMRHFTGDWAGSAAYLNSANEDIKNAVTQSLAKGAVAALGNENAKEYAGAIYESHFLNVFNSLNYYNRGDLESAVALMKDLAQKRVMYDMVALAVANESDDEAEKEAAADAAESDKKGKSKGSSKSASAAASSLNVDMNAVNRRSPPKPTEADVFSDSALERYVALNYYTMQLLDRSTPIEVRGIAEQEVAQQGALFALRAPDYDMQADISVPDGMGRVNVLAFSGLVGRRREHATYFPGDFISGMQFLPPVRVGDFTIPAFRLKFVYPEFIRQPKKIQRVTAVIGGEEIELAILEDLDNDVWMDVNVKAYKAFKRSVFRSILKKSAAIAAGSASIYASAQISDALANVAVLGVSAAIDAVDAAETADIRQVMALPASANAGGVSLEPGTYPVQVRYFDAGGRLVEEENLGNVTVRANKLVLLESLCIR